MRQDATVKYLCALQQGKTAAKNAELMDKLQHWMAELAAAPQMRLEIGAGKDFATLAAALDCSRNTTADKQRAALARIAQHADDKSYTGFLRVVYTHAAWPKLRNMLETSVDEEIKAETGRSACESCHGLGFWWCVGATCMMYLCLPWFAGTRGLKV